MKATYEKIDGKIVATIYSGDAAPAPDNVLDEDSKEMQAYLSGMGRR